MSTPASISLVLHGHFYQPPREDPWSGVIEDQPSAAPFANWNERILAECYRANAFAAVRDGDVVQRIVNNYSLLSFNFGPTLLQWLEPHDPDTYARILSADRESAAARGGHGNAIAQGYHHTILPLMLPHDRRTQIRWGIADFRHRFGRDPESLWLPETAADDATLADLVAEGMRFVILAPRQASRVRRIGESAWEDVNGSVEPGVPYRWSHPDDTNRSITVFFYDGHLAKGIAFEDVLGSSADLMRRIEAASGHRSLVHAATDGETYGHHVKFSDLTIAHTLTEAAPEAGYLPTNYGELLDRVSVEHEVELAAGAEGLGTSWSCEHGVSRWRIDCGCSTGGEPGWNQAWRAPLRAALDVLRDRAHAAYEEQMGRWFDDPWAVRDDAIRLRLRPAPPDDVFLRDHAHKELRLEEQARAILWLGIERHVMMMYTSCGWFFSDLAGIETVQVLAYAARALQLMERAGDRGARALFLEALTQARSNLPREGTGADIFLRYVVPRIR